MRKIKVRGQWLFDLMLFKRDSFSLHLFSLVILKGPRTIVRTPDFKIPMPLKVIKRRQDDFVPPAGLEHDNGW